MSEQIMKLAVKIIRALLDWAMSDPRKRRAIIEQARMLVIQVETALAQIDQAE